MEKAKLTSPVSGSILEITDEENLYYDKYAKVYIFKNQNGSLVPLHSSSSGAKLQKTDDKHIYYDKYSGVSEYLKDDGRLIPLVSPTSGFKLQKTTDKNIFVDPKGTKFILDDRGIIPTFIPDDTLEPAHIDGDYLVGNETGRKFPIRSNGKVVVPHDIIDIDPNMSVEEINTYFAARKQRQYHETQEWIDAQIAKEEADYQKAMDNLSDKILGSKETRENTEKFMSIIDEEIANGHELTDKEYAMLDMISRDGHLPEDMSSSEITYDPTYAFLKAKQAQVEAGYGLSQEDIMKLEAIVNGEKAMEEKSSHTR